MFRCDTGRRAAEQILYGAVMICPSTLQLVQSTDYRENESINMYFTREVIK